MELVAILGLVSLFLKIFGPTMSRFAEAEIEKFRAKHPDRPNVAAGLERMRAIVDATVHEMERQDFGELTGRELAMAKHDGAVRELLGDLEVQQQVGRLAVEGFNANRDDVDQLVKAAVDTMNYLPGGRKAPATPLPTAAAREG